MKVKLSLHDRVVLNNILPFSGLSKAQVFIFARIAEKLTLTKEEVEKFNVVIDTFGNTHWNEEGSKAEFDIEFDELEEQEVLSLFKKMDKENAFQRHHKNLIKLFNI